MSRKYSQMTPREIRAERECSLFEAVKTHRVSQLLDSVDATTSVEELRSLLARFITLQTGVS